MDRYTLHVHTVPGGYAGTADEFPDLTATAPSWKVAYRGIEAMVDTAVSELTALGQPVPPVTPPPHPLLGNDPAPYERREDRVTYELHRAVARKLLTDPAPIVALIPGNIAKIRRAVNGPLPQRWLDTWATAADGGVEDLIELMLGHDQEAKELRQNTPFAGALTQDERITAILRAGAKPDAVVS